jgi:hypothetical protein
VAEAAFAAVAGGLTVGPRWPNRAELVVAALAHQRGEPDPAPDTGSLREDLLALLRWGAQRLDGLFGEAVRGRWSRP